MLQILFVTLMAQNKKLFQNMFATLAARAFLKVQFCYIYSTNSKLKKSALYFW
jgi:hypothetical protein